MCYHGTMNGIRKIKINGVWQKTPEYRAWCHMKDRCYRKTTAHYPRYGGRGIKVFPLWMNDFEAFYKHIGKRPTAGHSLDRINNDGDYEPGNVRWADSFTQASNKGMRSSNTTGYTGVRFNKTVGKYTTDFSFKGRRHFFGNFDTAEEASIMREIGAKRIREESA